MKTIRDVALKAGVSPATVSRVLRGEKLVSDATRASVLCAVQDLGFQPNPHAQSLRSGRTRTVALAIGDIEQGVYSSLTKHLQLSLEAVGLDMMLFNLGHSQDRLQEVLRRAESMRLHGITIASSDRNDLSLQAHYEKLSKTGLPMLSIGQRLDKFGVTSIVHDDSRAAADTVAYLLERDRWPIAFLSRIRSSTSGAERFEGYRRGLQRAGVSLTQDLVWECADLSTYRYAAGFQAMSEAVARRQVVRSVLASSDELALGAMAAAIDAGLRIPQDIAFVGFGNIGWSAYVRPALTTLEGDFAQAATLAKDLFAGAVRTEPPRLFKLKRQLRVRESV